MSGRARRWEDRETESHSTPETCHLGAFSFGVGEVAAGLNQVDATFEVTQALACPLEATNKRSAPTWE
ncbi:hypothetical protein FJTKL_12230 [Diaporthe vaccinii]|uniref:Uncharacterized protein n=1 Tax=Diaporthe vaccinii TaxID=105482 RepID=A0ABR4EEP9_9PEZI